MKSRKVKQVVLVMLVLALLSFSIASIAIPASPPAGAAQAEEMVAFNTKTFKYHCLSCQWAIKCTRNCITIPVSEAKQRGGIPCKVCGGTCKR